MVGLVIVSHSSKLAEGVVDATRVMAEGCPIAAAGGADDGGFGTSYAKIRSAVEAVDGGDGVVVLMDMGSAVMTAEMVIEELGRGDVVLADCPVAEGAVAASVASVCGDDLANVKAKAEATWNERKTEEAS